MKSVKKRKAESLPLIFILIVAIALGFWRFNRVPPALFGDEIDTGYQAWSILKTGRDYFGNLLPIHFQSLGDWRMPLYIYLTVPSVAIFGLSEFAVRLPSLIFSLTMLVVSYFLVKRISSKKVAVYTAFFLATSGWFFHFSQVAFEVTLFNLLSLAGILLFLKALEEKGKLWLILSAVFWGLSVYAYSTAKLFMPIFILILIVIFRRKIFRQGKLLVFVSALILVSLPMLSDILFGEGGARFKNISIFTLPTVAQRVEMARRECPWSGSLARIFHNKVWYYAQDFFSNYLKSFSPEYLFISGDPNARHNPLAKGQLELPLLPLILIGIFSLAKEYFSRKEVKLILPLAILLLTPLPAALTQNGGTHAIRTYQFLPWWQFLAAFGWVSILPILKNRWQKKLVIMIFSLSMATSAFLFWHSYWGHFPRQPGAWWRWWNYGYREVFEYVNKVENNYEKIYISPSHDPPFVYALFYNRYPPEKTQKEISISPVGFGKFIFTDPDLSFLKSGEKKKGILFVSAPGSLEASGYDLSQFQDKIEILKKVVYPENEVYPGKEVVFYIFKTL